jgi:mannose-6-phosphate isomerase-like protein (cupin superfamily)
MLLSRREACGVFPGAVLTALIGTAELDKQQAALPSAAYSFEKLPVHTSNGAQFRDVLKGKLATGESLEVHETMLPAGGAPHPPHHHMHSEMWLIREGTVELMVNGSSYRLGPGSVGFVHSNDEHGIRNVGTTPASYFVVAIGPGANSQT